MYKNKKIVVVSIILLVLVVQSLSNWIYFVIWEEGWNDASWWDKKNIAQASGPKEENKLVAIFVEQNIYQGIQWNLQRYALKYIQERFPRTKALIFPVDTSTIGPKDIQKILSNLYHGGEKDVPSTLIGTILIWNIPLPTIETSVNNEMKSQKSILPYTDLEKPTYVYDNEKEKFLPTSTNVDNEQELFHWLIIFNSAWEYNDYFDKLKIYINDPKSFATKKMWYDDFIQLQKNYTEQNSPIYAKKQIFDEDLLYHRYTPALFNIIAEDSNDDALNILSEKIDIPAPTPANESTPLFSAEEEAYNNWLKDWQDNLAKQADENKDKIKKAAWWENIPTLVMGQSILEQLKNYGEIFSPEYWDIIFNQMWRWAWRWTGVDIANNITKISTFDDVSSQLIYTLNNGFENILDAKISGDALSLEIPIPVFSESYTCDRLYILCNSCSPNMYSCEKRTWVSLSTARWILWYPITETELAAWWWVCETKKLQVPDGAPDTYEAFYFGKNALDITGADQTTWYRGTYGNITDASIALSLPWSKESLGIWSSFGFTDQQVIASRWYNLMKAQWDGDVLNELADGEKKSECSKKIKKVAKKAKKWSDEGVVEFFANNFRGWHSALNLTWDGPMYLASDLRQKAYNPSTNRLVWGALFDIAGSSLMPVTGSQYTWTNALSVDEYGHFRVTTVWNKNIFDWIPIVGWLASNIVSLVSDISWLYEKELKDNEEEVDWCNDTKYPILSVKGDKLDYFSAIEKKNTDVQIVKQQTWWKIVYNDLPTCKTRIIYKTISSIVKHTSPTPDEVKGMNIATQARWVDTKRYISFKGIAGNIINLYYPNVYDVPVYVKSWSARILQNTTGIKENIKTYLQDVVKEHNKILLAENDKIAKYFSGNREWFDSLAKKYPLASPKNRKYNAIPEDFYTKLLNEETLTQLADILYVKNSPRSSKFSQNTVAKTIDQSISTMHIENKIQNIMWRNLVIWKKWIGVNTSWYELAYIRSAGTDSISNTTSVPSFIQDAIKKIDQRKAKNITDGKGAKSDIQQQVLDVACSAGSDGTVPLLKWPKALTCRRKNLQTLVKEGKIIEVTYKNTTGPVYPLKQFKQLKELQLGQFKQFWDDLKQSYTDYIAYVTGVLNPQLWIPPTNEKEASEFAEQAKTNAFIIGSMTIDTPTKTVIRGSIIPISISAKNINGDALTNFYNPARVDIDKWFFPEASTDVKMSTQIDITDPWQPVFIDTKNVPSNSTITVNAVGGDGVVTKTEILVVDATLRVLINDSPTNEATIKLPNTSYVNTSIGTPIVFENKLPTLKISLTDPSGKPLHSLAQITSEKWLIQPCKIIAENGGKQCMQESLRDINGEANIRLLPSMKAGKDAIHINISWLPERIISFDLKPADPYKVTVAENTGKKIAESPHVVLLELFDVRNNKVIDPTNITYNLIWEATDMADATWWILQIKDGKGLLPIKFGKQGGANYIYAEIWGKDTIPWYMRWDTAMELRPKEKLNVVYLTLLGDDRGNPETTKIPSIIMDSPKLFTVTTSLENPTDTEPVDLEPLRSYGWGKTVGESRKMQFDPSIITYWDPMLQHADANLPLLNDATSVKIGWNSEKTITKVIEFDIDNDGRKDMLILYEDDSIEFMKQYWWSPTYRKLGNLMSVVDGVANIRVWDANNDRLPDIFVKTKRETLRVYTNKNWAFPTDGVPICLNVPTGTTSTKWIWDLEVADMNKDGNIDIVTNDIRGQITIFYGWDSGKWWYYVSNADWLCDDQWFERQKNNNLVVSTFGMSLQERVKIFDDSLLHWWWLSLPPDDWEIEIPLALQEQLLPNEKNPSNFNLDALMKIWVKDIVRFSGTPYDTLPYYERWMSLETIAYVPSRHIIDEDPVLSYKTYSHWKEWEIIVTVRIRAKFTTKVTYIEQLLWPWKIKRGENYNIIWFNSGSLVWLQTAVDWVTKDIGNAPFVNWNPWNPWNGYQFMIDNMSLQGWQTVSFSYPITYTPAQIARIKVEDKNKDWRLDISTTSLDQCSKTQVTFQSVFGKSYQTITINEIPVNVASWVVASGQDIQKKAENWLIESIDWLSDVIEKWDSGKTRVQNLKDTNALENWFSFNGSFDVSEAILWKEANKWISKAEGVASTILQWACKWFVSGWWTKWLPVPFNVALLAPWDINVFGCKVFKDKGLPIFAVPTAGIVPVWPPNPAQAWWRFGWASSISQIRIYVAPTLTLWIGVAICLGPYAVWNAIPSPLRALWGNCIVFAKRPWSENWPKPPIDGASAIVTDDANTVGKACRDPYPDPLKPISPITYGTSKGWVASTKLNRSASTEPNISAGWNFPGWTYLGILDLDIWPEVENNLFEETNKDQLKWGKPVRLKIQTGKVNWLLKCIVQKWLDNQIRYIANNLTNMSINITIPDPSNIFDGFKNLDLGWLDAVTEWFKKDASGTSPAGSALKDLVTISSGDMLWTKQEEVANLSAITSNPFNALSSWFEQVPMIRVNTKNVTIQIPFIYPEELSKYIAQAEAYSEKIESNIDEWKKWVDDFAWKCWSYTNELQKDACNNQLENHVKFKDNLWKTQTDIKKLLQTLQAYKRFPASLKSRVTVNERYMTELSDTVQGISTDMTSRLNTNASRFSSYVDSIILMVWAVKSWQPILKLSTEWKSNCGKCTVDTYDYYSCSLSLLCPTLPILAIPPFKIPNIYIDLSNINLWIDVLLPNIRFVPRRIELPDLPIMPAIPAPWGDISINLDVKIPSIPTLPAPPTLPELPSFIPKINLNLPTLPPAPKIPNLNPSIATTIKVMSKIAKILCMVKNVKLVGEGDVKSKIEQLTQRTWNVEPFDSLSTTIVTPPLRWFDIKISTYLNFEFNFDGLYDIVNELAKKVNEKTKVVTDWVWKQNTAIEQGLNWTNELLDQLDINKNLEINWSIWKDGIKLNYNPTRDLFKNKQMMALSASSSRRDPQLIDSSEFRFKLQNEISAFKQSEFGNEYKKDIDMLQWILDANTKVTPDYASIQKASNSLQILIAKKKTEMATAKSQLDDYDKFLDKINTAALITERSVEGIISARLYKADEKTKYIMDNAEHPMKSYIDLESTLASGFLVALQNHAPEELNMNRFTYNNLLRFLENTTKDIHTIRGIIEPVIQKQKENKIVAVTNRLENLSEWLQTTIAPKAQAAPIKKDEKIIVEPLLEDFENNGSQNQWSNNQSSQGGAPINVEWKIWRDEHNIYTNHTTRIKQINDGARFSRYYQFKPIQHYRNLLEQADRNGFISLYNSAFDVANISPVITSLEAVWQSNNTASIQWLNTKQQVYILSLENRIIDNHELDTEKKYIIAYVDWVDLSKTYLDIDWLPKKKLSEITVMDNIKLLKINSESETIALTLDLPEKIWSYIQIAHCMITPRENMDWSNLQRTSAWSHQETLWSQKRWDTAWPNVTVKVINKKTNEVIYTGTTARLPRKGAYDVMISWNDEDTVVENSWNKENDKNIITKDGWENIIQNIPIQEDATPLIYEISAFDQASNTTRETINIVFVDPTIYIESAPKKGAWFNIDSNLSMLYPDAYVRFYALRNGMEFLLTGRNWQQIITDFPTRSLDTQVIWGIFGDADTITLVDEKNEDLVKIDKKTWKITPCSWKKKSYYIRLEISNNVPVLLIIDSSTWKTLFTIYIKAKNIVDAKSLNPDYPLIDIPDDFPWTFAGWQCLQDKDNPKMDTCALYLSKDGNMFIPDANQVRFGWAYTYNWWVEYTLALDGSDVLKTVFTPEEMK